MAPNRIIVSEVVGKKFGRLLVLRVHGHTKSGNKLWWCRCECGTEKAVHHAPMIKGVVVSCGCYNQQRKTTFGGLQKTYPREYKIWHGIVKRCTDPNNRKYKDYGARGIKVSEGWLGQVGFQNFIDHIGPCTDTTLSVDRINNEGHYEPGNVRWATDTTQSNNRRSSHYLTFDGRTQSIRQWGKEVGINEQTLHERLKRGWSVERTLTTPLKR